MDSSLKERLVGAAVLVGIGVLFIPMLLDGPEPTEPSPAVELPADDVAPPRRTQTIDLQARNAAPAARPAPASEPPPGAEIETRAADLPAQARSKSGPDEATARPSGDASWLVQLGSFGDEANARRLAERVSTYGYQPQVSTYRSGARTLYRVRVGAGGSRNEADAMASSLAAHGFVAQAVPAD